MLTDGYHDIPPGKIAAIVTHLEMRAPAPLRGRACPDGVTFRRIESPPTEWYRDLFQRIGGNWLWFSRLSMSQDALSEILNGPGQEVYAVENDGTAEGLVELDFSEKGACELAFFGLTPALVGAGVGSWLMDQAISRAWSKPIDRFHVHTCTLDHPGALAFYVRSGFTPISRQIEIADDPRLHGILPKDSAPHFPVVDS